MSPEAVGFDVCWFDPNLEFITIGTGETKILRTGLKFEISIGWEMQVRCRSSLGVRYGLSLPHSIGTVDSDYRGELFVPLVNNGIMPHTFQEGERIAQIVMTRNETQFMDVFEEVDTLSATARGEGGFGSTGT